MAGENQCGVIYMDTHPGVVCLTGRAERRAALAAKALTEVTRVICG